MYVGRSRPDTELEMSEFGILSKNNVPKPNQSDKFNVLLNYRVLIKRRGMTQLKIHFGT